MPLHLPQSRNCDTVSLMSDLNFSKTKQQNERRNAKKTPWSLVALCIVAVCVLVILCTPLAGRIKRSLLQMTRGQSESALSSEQIEQQVEKRLRAEYEAEYQAKTKDFIAKQLEKKEEELRPPEVEIVTDSSKGDVKKLRSGIPFHSSVELSDGGFASSERVADASYSAHYTLKLALPKAAQTIADLQKNSPGIDKILPGLAKLSESPQVSPRYKEMYQNKVKRIRQDATNLNELISKHNFFDLETMLQFQDPTTKRRGFLMQAEMDVVSDGSDGDRLPNMPEVIVNSTNYQPFTSYGWKKVTNTPNPMVAGWEKRIVLANEELAAATTTNERKTWLRDRISYLKRGIDDMKSRSFLIAEHDPFIVMPVNLLTATDAYAPKIGDYAVVIHAGKIYPCIVGDGGPSYKVGEASLRLAKALNPRATPYSRPESDLKVTYLVFPNSRDEKRSAPDYAAWAKKCGELLAEIGGLGENYQLHEWTNTLPPTTP